MRLGALISLGLVDEPVSLDGCESHAQKYTEIEIEMRRNVKLVSMFAAKPGENSENGKGRRHKKQDHIRLFPFQTRH